MVNCIFHCLKQVAVFADRMFGRGGLGYWRRLKRCTIGVGAGGFGKLIGGQKGTQGRVGNASLRAKSMHSNVVGDEDNHWGLLNERVRGLGWRLVI